MRFAATIDIELPDDVAQRAPTFWEECQSLFGGRDAMDLTTDVAKCRVDAGTFLYEVRRALDALGIDNARWLVVDGALVFEDHKQRPNDLPELMTAFADHLLLATGSIQKLRLCVEHEEAGLAVEIEARMAAEHPREEPAARVTVTGRMLDLAPRRNESAEAYRERLEEVAADAPRWAAVKMQFATFLSRLEQALGAALPGATLHSTSADLGIDVGAQVSLWPEPSKRQPLQTATPPRNFTLSVEQRVAAAVAGPPPYAMRLRKIEDLRAELVRLLALEERESLDAVPAEVRRGLIELNRLIAQHNRYYPIERNLAMDVGSGAFLALDQPWKPLPEVSLEDLRRDTAAMRGGARRG